MRLGLVLASLLTAGCRQIFGVEPPGPLVDAPPSDAADAMQGDVMPPAAPCFADAALMFGACLNAFPSSEVVFNDQVIDTDAAASCAPLASSTQDLCVIAGTDVTIPGIVVATGARPLVIWATGTILIEGTLDVASHHASFGHPLLTGAGFEAGGCPSPLAAGVRGGGAGGSFVTTGGAGGRDVTTSGSTGGAAAVTIAASVFRGGCAGGDGSDSAMAGGPGGGAVALVAPQVDLKGGIVDASGAGGTQGGTAFRGGAGGGSGGMILVLAQSTMLDQASQMFANGGGGGGGGLNNAAGGVGGDPANPQSPGVGGTSQGPGTGGAGYPQVQDGRSSSILTACGGGGGGGGAGAIIVRGALASSGSISPAPIN